MIRKWIAGRLRRLALAIEGRSDEYTLVIEGGPILLADAKMERALRDAMEELFGRKEPT